MLKHDLLITCRNLLRSRTSLFVNLVSMSAALTCVLLIYLFVTDELAVDSFHQKGDRIYQVLQNTREDEQVHTTDATPGPLAQALKEEITGIEDAVVEYPGRGSKGIVSLSDHPVNVDELYVTPNYFTFFSYTLLHGNAADVLTDNYSVVISDELAINLFGSTNDVVGKTLHWNQGNLTDLEGDYLITGIFEKSTATSSIRFDVLFTFDLLREKTAARLRLDKWTTIDPRTYVLLEDGVSKETVNEQIKELLFTKGAVRNRGEEELFLQQFSDRYLYGQFENGKQAGGRITYVHLFAGIAAFILVIACINFMNLSTAMAARRAKEIGVKKVMGASSRRIYRQFMLEALLITLVAIPVALTLTELLLPQFNTLTGKHLTLQPDRLLLTGVAGMILITTLLAGSYPAFYLSRLAPSTLIRNRFGMPSRERLSWIRNGLVVFQFTVTAFLIVSVLVLHSQLDLIQSKDLGFRKESVIHFVTKGNLLKGNVESFVKELKEIPGVVNVATYQSNLITENERGRMSDIDWEGKPPGQQASLHYLMVGYDFMETAGMELVQGRSFSPDFTGEENNVVLNEAAIRQFGITDPVGKNIQIEGEAMQIIGVVKNFHFESLYDPIKPCGLFFRPRTDRIMVKLEAGTQPQTLQRLSEFYAGFNDGLTFEYEFLDDDYRALYASEERTNVLARYFAGMAVLISCMGVYGLIRFMAERRMKEISIRKILGAGIGGIALNLSSSFARMLALAFAIAFPASYLVATAWLESFAFHASLRADYFIGTAACLVFVTALTLTGQVIKAAKTNPAVTLKNE